MLDGGKAEIVWTWEHVVLPPLGIDLAKHNARSLVTVDFIMHYATSEIRQGFG